MSYKHYLQKVKYVSAILRALRDQGWVYDTTGYVGTIAQKGEWSFVLWNNSPYAKEFAVPQGKNWALYYKDRVIDAGRKLKPPEGVIKRVVEKASKYKKLYNLAGSLQTKSK